MAATGGMAAADDAAGGNGLTAEAPIDDSLSLVDMQAKHCDLPVQATD
jgi:hypothetical protein